MLKESIEREDSSTWKTETMKWIELSGMHRFAEAAIWLMKKNFGLDGKYLLCESIEKYRSFVLNEILQIGNMGSDVRLNRKYLNSAAGRYLLNLKRDVTILKECPHET